MYTWGIPVTMKNPSDSKARCCFNLFSRSVVSDSIATPWTVPRQAPLSWDFPGKNTGVGCFSFSRGSSWPRGRTLASFIVGRFFTAEPPGSPKARCRVYYSAPRRRRRTSLEAQMVKHLPTMRETQVQSLGQEYLLDKEMATHSSIPTWKIPWTEKPGRLQSMGSQRVGHDWASLLYLRRRR